MAEPRPLYEIADEIVKDWGYDRVSYAAKPYLRAMTQMSTMQDSVGFDDARGIVLYFLSNAKSWRGDTARRVKAELKAMAKR